ncbi:MAG: porin [Pseudomonadota bacterium]
MRHLLPAAVALSALVSCAAHAKDDLLEALAQKGVISLEEYERLKAQRKSDLVASTDDGFRLSTADGTASMQLGTLQQLDVASYQSDQTDLADGSELRRSRLSLSGTFLKDWQYRFEHEFSGTTGVTDAYLAYAALKPFTITVGQFKQPFGMEALAADKNIPFMERSLPFAFVTTRAPGLMLGSSGPNWSANGGVFGEPVGNAQAGDEGYGLVARASYAPLLSGGRLIHLGFAGVLRYPTAESSSNTAGARSSTVRFRSKPESNVLAQRLVDTGEIRGVDSLRIEGIELAVQQGALSLQAEGHFVQVQRETGSTLNFNGWCAQIAFTLTGEARPYKVDKGVFDGIRPAHNFGRDGWGAFDLAARMSAIDLSSDAVNGGLERNASIALNWTLNPQLRISANVVRVLRVEGGASHADEPTIYQVRMQLAL